MLARTEMRLSECSFREIYLPEADEQKSVIRGLSIPGAPARDGQSGRFVSSLPPSLSRDCATFLAKVGANCRDPSLQAGDSFITLHDGVRYRCSRMWVGNAPAGTRIWAIRRISRNVPKLADLGMPVQMIKALRRMEMRTGLLAVGGSFGSGKTTSAASVFDEWVSATREVGVTFEDPPEFSMERVGGECGSVVQTDVTDYGYAMAMRESRRWAPRFVLVGEIRDPETAAETLHMAISGPLVVTTVHGADTISTLLSLARYAARAMPDREARQLLAAALSGVLQQSVVDGKTEFSLLSMEHPDQARSVRGKIETGEYRKIEEDILRQARVLDRADR